MLESRYGSASLVLDKSTLWVTGIFTFVIQNFTSFNFTLLRMTKKNFDFRDELGNFKQIFVL